MNYSTFPRFPVAVLVDNGKHDLRSIEGGKIVFDVIAHAIGAAEDAN